MQNTPGTRLVHSSAPEKLFDLTFHVMFQAAVDAFQLSLMREFNKRPSGPIGRDQVQPLVYGTYQAYLRRCGEILLSPFRDASQLT